MLNDIFCGSAYIGENKGISLEYFIVPGYVYEDNKNVRQYGIKVKKTVLKNAKETEVKEIKNVFCDEGDARRFVNLIMKNRVTPVSLLDIAEDYLAGI